MPPKSSLVSSLIKLELLAYEDLADTASAAPPQNATPPSP